MTMAYAEPHEAVAYEAGPHDGIHPLRARGPKYPPHDQQAPILGGIDIAGLVAGAIITLGPLAAYSFGMGA